MDRELQILREAALISMSKKVEQQEAKELAELREAALDSARERKLSSDLQRKRRLESPPSHHYDNHAHQSYESDDSGDHTPKMSECDSAQNTPPRDDTVQDTVFTVKVTDNMLLKRTPNKCKRSSESEASEECSPLSPTKQDNNVEVVLTDIPSDGVPEPEKEDPGEELDQKEESEEESEKDLPEEIIPKEKSPEPVISIPEVTAVAEISPAVSKVSSFDDPSTAPPKKQKKKHKKKKSSVKRKRLPKPHDSSSEDEKSSYKSSRIKRLKKHNGETNHSKDLSKVSKEKNGDENAHKLPRNLKKELINELDSKIDKNIEILQRAKKLKQENKNSKPVSKKVVSEISSNEEAELLKPEKKKSLSPKDHKKDKARDSKNSKTRSRSSSVPDISVSLKSKREFEQMKAEMNKNVPKPTRKYETKKSTPRKDRRRSPSPKRNHRSYSPKQDVRSSSARNDVRPSPKKDVRYSSPKKDVRSSFPKNDVRSTSPKKEVRLSSPKKDVRSSPPKKDIRPSPPKKDVRSPHKKDVRPSSPKNDVRSSPKKDIRPSVRKPIRPSPAKLAHSFPRQDEPSQNSKTVNDDMHITETEELELLGEITKPIVEGLKPVDILSHVTPEDAISILKEDDSFSESDEGGDVVNITCDKKPLGDAKKKKLKKSKKKKNKEEKKKKKKRKKQTLDDISSSDSDSPEKKKAKVKIDKSELNKIVQFLKQRDEQQKAIDGSLSSNKTSFNPKIINKDPKSIEIKLKTKPKR